MKTFVTKNSKETQKLGKTFARKMKCGGILCLEGNLGSGKTTFTQGFLKELKVKGPYTSPTFLIMKHYKKETRNKRPASNASRSDAGRQETIFNIYHIDAYRIGAKDILNLGWKEIIAPPAGEKKNIIVVEWADRIKKIIPKSAVWLKFEWVDKNEREIVIK